MTTRRLIIMCALAAALFPGCGPGPHPATFDDLARAYREAHAARSLEGIDRLVYWGNMPPEDKDRIRDGIKRSFEKNVAQVVIGPLDADFTAQAGTSVYPFPPEKSMQVDFANPGNKGGELIGTVHALGMKDALAWIVYRSETAR